MTTPPKRHKSRASQFKKNRARPNLSIDSRASLIGYSIEESSDFHTEEIDQFDQKRNPAEKSLEIDDGDDNNDQDENEKNSN